MAKHVDIPDVSVGGTPEGETLIRLGSFLKLSGLIDSGGEAKEAIASLRVSVNGEVDERRGRQLRDGDVVTVDGRSARVRP